jgi:hypothetical protein
MSIVTAYLNQTVTLEPFSSDDGYGEKSYVEAATVSARVDYKQTEVRSDRGETHISTAQVMLEGDQSVSLNDRITLPDGTKPPILAITKTPDVSGTIVLQVVYT